MGRRWESLGSLEIWTTSSPWTSETLATLDGDVEAIKRKLVDVGHWWVWMRPDRFPLERSTPSAPSYTEPSATPTSSSSPTSFTSLPTDVLFAISSYLPLSSLISLSPIFRLLRSNLLVREGNDVARAWLGAEGAYWLPSTEDGLVQGGWFDYVKGCVESGSMRNRKRIWGVVGRLEALVDEAEEQEAKGKV